MAVPLEELSLETKPSKAPSRSGGDGRAPGDPPESETLLIMPCLRLPPRGTTCEEWSKPLWVHPFWLVSRTSDPAAANMEMKFTEVQVVKTFLAGQLDVGLKSWSGFAKVTIPVMTTKEPVKQGTVLSIWTSAVKPKKTKDNIVRWDSRGQQGGSVKSRRKTQDEGVI